EVVKDLIQFYEARNAKIILLSEYGINAVDNPIHINRILRNEGLISVRVERWYELLDAGASKAFAVSDHQIAHVYLNDPSVKERVVQVLKKTPGIDLILDKEAQKAYHIDHERSGDIVVVAKPDSWFTYYYWIDDA